MRIIKTIAAIVLACALCSAATAQATRSALDIKPQPMRAALKALGEQTGLQILFRTEDVARDGRAAPPVTGRLSAQEALEQLLANSGLKYEFVNDRTVRITAAASEESAKIGAAMPAKWQGEGKVRLAQAEPAPGTESAKEQDSKAAADALEGTQAKIPEILVKGSRMLNMDIPRNRDDPQPYVIFNREVIERSGVRNLSEFLKQRLPSNAVGLTPGQLVSDARGDLSSISLRGLGPAQTLILVDGHRMASGNFFNSPSQPDLNGIPLAAVERIEVLPTTASGIYGGSATGGAINIILRRDYAGMQAKVGYENTFDADAARRQVDLSGGFSLEGGRTNILIAGSYTDNNFIQNKDRGFVERGYQRILANNSSSFFNVATPPQGALPNIRSATVVGGVTQNLTLKNGIALGSPFTTVPAGYAGPTSDGGLALVANAGRYNFDLADTAQLNGARQGLLNAPTVESLMMTVRREFGSRVQAFLDLAASNSTGHRMSGTLVTFLMPSTAAANPFQQAIRVRVPDDDADFDNPSARYNRHAVGGVIVQLPGSWMTELDYNWTRERFSTRAANDYGAALPGVVNGTLPVLRDLSLFPTDFTPFLVPNTVSVTPFYTTMREPTLRASGPTFSLPGGPVVLSMLLAQREEKFDATEVLFLGSRLIFPRREQEADSAYLELRAPLISARNHIPAVRELELQLAGRYEEFKTLGSTQLLTTPTAPVAFDTNKGNSIDPTIGLRYQSLEMLTFRGSYGTGFLPPSVNQIIQTNFAPIPINILQDPRRGFERNTAPVQTLGGGNPNLKPEKSESWSAGLILEPRQWLPGLRFSLDYTRIDKNDNIATLSVQQILDNEQFAPSQVIRGPVPANDPFGVGPIVAIDQGAVNVAKAWVEAWDVQLDYGREVGRAGRFDFYALATWQTHLKTQLVPTAPIVENVGIGSAIPNSLTSTANPLKFKANAGVTWAYRNLKLNWNTQYFHSYLVASPFLASSATVLANQAGVNPNGSLRGSPSVDSQVYHDLFASWSFDDVQDAGGLRGILSDSELQVGVKNVFNTKPPFDAANTASFYSYFGDPRLALYSISFTKNF